MDETDHNMDIDKFRVIQKQGPWSMVHWITYPDSYDEWRSNDDPELAEKLISTAPPHFVSGKFILVINIYSPFNVSLLGGYTTLIYSMNS